MLLFTDSFDHYAIGDLTEKWTSDSGASSIVAGAGRCSSAAYRNTSSEAGPTVGVSNTTNNGVIGVAYNPEAYSLSHDTICKAGANGQNLMIASVMADGSVQLWKGLSVTVTTGGGASLGFTAPGLVPLGIFTFIELETLFDATVGYARVYINGVLKLSFSGNTICAGGGGYSPIYPWTLAVINPRGFIDDVYVLNGDNSDGVGNTAPLGDVHIEAIRAVPDSTAVGTRQQWTPLSGTDHGAMVDETPPDNDTTYNHSGTVGNRDTYRFPSLVNLTSGVIHAVTFLPNARKTDDISSRSIAVTQHVSGVDHDGVAQAVSSNYKYWFQVYGANPATGAKYTVAQVNLLDAGVKDAA